MKFSLLCSALLFMSLFSLAQTVDYGELLIKAINDTSSEKQQEIITNSFSERALQSPGLKAIAGVINRWHETYAPMEYHHTDVNSFVRPTGTVYVMHVYARKQGASIYQDFQIYLDPNPPHKLEKIAFIAEVAEPVTLPNGSIDQAETLNWLQQYADKLNTTNDLYGSYRIIKGTQILFDRQMGYEDVEKKRPITRKSLFNLASGGKMFTAVAIGQLVESERLSYSDPITRYVNGFSDSQKADRITLHHVLSHTSGVNEYWSGATDRAVLSARNINDHLKLVYEAGLDFDAGTQYRYCNSNYILLGAIIEKVTGLSFFDYVQKNIFDRAGMSATGYFEYDSQPMARPLVRDGNTTGWIEGRHGIKGSSAGGAYSTLADMEQFARALRSNVLIQKQTLTTMTSIQNNDSSESYGYGFQVNRLSGTFGYGHGGTSDGVNFEMDYYPGLDVTVILFCNQNNGAYDDLKKNMIKLITGHR